MAKIAELVAKYKQGEMSFDALLAEVPSLEWGKRHEAADGELWVTGENSVADVEVLWYDEVITEDERTAILNAIT